jgi:hypothetical protein
LRTINPSVTDTFAAGSVIFSRFGPMVMLLIGAIARRQTYQ